jgi:hypothetical protein
MERGEKVYQRDDRRPKTGSCRQQIAQCKCFGMGNVKIGRSVSRYISPRDSNKVRMANRKHGDREQQGRVSLPRYLTHEDKGRATPQELFSHHRALLIGPSWAHGGKEKWLF